MIHPPDPMRDHPDPIIRNSYVISSRRAWLPGLYDSARAARYAFRFPTAVLYALETRVLRGEKRLITFADLQATRKEMT